MVRAEAPEIGNDWERAPLPILVVEVFSPTTLRRDQTYKKDFYSEARIPEYWMIDPERRTVAVARPGEVARGIAGTVVWQPAGVSEPLVVDLAELFVA